MQSRPNFLICLMPARLDRLGVLCGTPPVPKSKPFILITYPPSRPCDLNYLPQSGMISKIQRITIRSRWIARSSGLAADLAIRRQQLRSTESHNIC